MNLKEKLNKLPQKPGVYQFKNHAGEVLYVGKAKNLRNRVRSYFLKTDDSRGPRIDIMKSQIADIDYVVVSSEVESLILENNLIKQYQPRFNVSLRDGKNYQFIKIDYEAEIPQIYPIRNFERKRSSRDRYFGPYTSSIKPTLRLITNIFHLCRAKKVTNKPCFAYHLGRCPGVCFGQITVAEYRKTFRQIEDFLKHRQTELIKTLRVEMKSAAAEHKFERAGILRDKLYYLEHLWQRQKIVSAKKEDQDYLGLFKTAREAVVAIFLVREGKLIHTEYFNLDHASASDEEILEKFLLQYYPETSDPPREIFFSKKVPNHDLIQKTLSQLKGQKVILNNPTRGKKLKLIELAAENAALYHERELASFSAQGRGASGGEKILEDLKSILNLPALPLRIEGYDISNIQGTNPVGSMVVFTNGKPDKSQYRKFKINIKDTPDDFAMMREMLERRFSHLPLMRGRMGGGRGAENTMTSPAPPHEEGEDTRWPSPDLIIIDGGKGQLNVAVNVLHQLPPPVSQLPVMGLAKRIEEIFLPGRKDPILLASNNPVLFLLQRVRDEAHRFAITFYRSRHRKAQTYSRLQDIAGVGPVSRKKLLQQFGSVAAIKNASFEAVARAVGRALAKKIREQL